MYPSKRFLLSWVFWYDFGYGYGDFWVFGFGFKYTPKTKHKTKQIPNLIEFTNLIKLLYFEI